MPTQSVNPRSRVRRSHTVLTLAAVAALTAATFAQSPGRSSKAEAQTQALAEVRNMDARVGLIVPLAGPSAEQQADVTDLYAAMPDLRAEFDPSTGATKSLWNMAGFLTQPDARDPKAIAQDYMMSRKALLGLSDADVVDVEVTDEVYSSLSGVTHLYYRQRVNGIPLYNAQLQFNITKDGRVLSINNAFLPQATAAIKSLEPVLDAAAAVRSAAERLGVRGVSPTVAFAAQGIRQTTELSAPDLSAEPITAELMILPLTRGAARLVWNFPVWTLDSQHAFDMNVDAETGQVWTRTDWVAADSYRVYQRPVESPNHTSPLPPADGRTLVSNPANATASPFGWHDTNGVAGAEFTTTEGNNVSAYTDVDANNLPDAGSSPNCGAGLACDFAIDLTQAPSAYRPAAVANLFYWNNIIHDVQYRYGFDEAGGNFQVNNYGRGGIGNDSVQAEAQDGSGTNNANFATPADGARPRMQMYLWNTTPNRDGDLDSGVIVHEYGHGISNRLVGGPSNVSCLGNNQQPGEGISDWLALAYTATAGQTSTQPRGMGTYVLNQPTNGTGIRALPYSTDNAVNNWTYQSIAGAAIPHGVGAVWAQGMWEVYWALVTDYGFDPNLYNSTGGAGNQRAMLYNNEGLKNSACSPGFTQLRDGIIQAAQTLNGGADVCRLWTAFAAFGLGADAVNPNSNSTSGVVNGFNLPAACGGTVVPTMNIGDATVTEGQTGTTTATFNVTLNTSSSQEVRATYATANGTATAGSDYVAASGQVIIPAGQTTGQIQVTINGDVNVEPAETFTVTLSAPVGVVLGDSSGLGTIVNDDGLTSVTIAANAGTLGPIPDSGSTTCQVPGPPRDVTVTVAGLPTSLLNVEVSTAVTHTFVGDVTARLTGPTAATHVLFGATGATTANGAGYSSDLAGTYVFRDSSANNWWTAAAVNPVALGNYRTAQVGGVGATGTNTSIDPVFAGSNPNGTWTLRFTDGCNLDTGTVSAASITLTFTNATPPTTVNDTYAATFNTALNVVAPGVLGNDTGIGGESLQAELVSGPNHGALTLNTNGSFTYTPTTGYSGADSFTYRALGGGGAGNPATVSLTVSGGTPTTVSDALSTTYPSALNLAAPGVLANDNANGGGALTAALVSNVTNGTLTLGANGSVSYTPNFGFAGNDSFTYRAVGAGGNGNVATVTIEVAPPTNVQAPYNFRVDSVVGNTVTLRWDALPIGPQASTFILEGGAAPGQVLASIPTGNPAPIYTIVAPTGSWFIRMRGQIGSDTSTVSNEVPLFVNVPVTPSAPRSLTGLVNGSTLDLSWKNTFEGGPPSGMILDVTGSATASLPMGATDRFNFTPAPGGSYTFRVRETNGGGASPASDPVTLTFPGGCTGAPEAARNFLGYHIGSTVYVIWDPPSSGAAPTSYLLDVTGSFTGQFPTTGRALNGAAGPGAYIVRVQSVNACGASPFTAAQTVTLP